MIFEWDAGKAASNVRKHGVSFETATRVWHDPYFEVWFDQTKDDQERWHAVGLISPGALLVVVHVYLNEEDGEQVVRIVSARRATRSEWRRYEQGEI